MQACELAKEASARQEGGLLSQPSLLLCSRELENWLGGGEAGTVARDGGRGRLDTVGLSRWSVDIILTQAAAELWGKAPVLMLFAA